MYNLKDDSFSEIKDIVVKLNEQYNKVFKGKKDPKNARLYINITRGPFKMKNGEWSKLDYTKLTLNPQVANSYFKLDNINWGYLIANKNDNNLMKVLDPYKIKQHISNLKITKKGAKLVKFEGKVVGVIELEVPADGLESQDKETPDKLEKLNYIGVNEFKDISIKLLSKDKNEKLSQILLKYFNNEIKLDEKFEEKEDLKIDNEEAKEEDISEEDISEEDLNLEEYDV